MARRRRARARPPDARSVPRGFPSRAHQRGDVRHHRRPERRVRRDPHGSRIPECRRQHALDGVLVQRRVRGSVDDPAAHRAGRQRAEPGHGASLAHGDRESRGANDAVGDSGLHLHGKHSHIVRPGVLGRAGRSEHAVRGGSGHVGPRRSEQLRRLCRVWTLQGPAAGGSRRPHQRDPR